MRTTLGSEVCLVYRDSGDFANIGVVELLQGTIISSERRSLREIIFWMGRGEGRGRVVSRWASEALNRGVLL